MSKDSHIEKDVAVVVALRHRKINSSQRRRLQRWLEICREETTATYFGSLQFSGRPSSPMYCRTGLGSLFVLVQRKIRQMKAWGALIHWLVGFAFTFLLHCFVCFHSRFGCVFWWSFRGTIIKQMQVRCEHCRYAYFSSASRSGLVRAYSFTWLFWRTTRWNRNDQQVLLVCQRIADLIVPRAWRFCRISKQLQNGLQSATLLSKNISLLATLEFVPSWRFHCHPVARKSDSIRYLFAAWP